MTGDLAKAVMFPWKEKFLEKFARLEIVGKLYTRYSDVYNIVVEEVGHGADTTRRRTRLRL